MIRSDAEHRRAIEKINKDAEAIREQRKHLAEMELSHDEIERALQPSVSFRRQLEEEIETYERMKRGDLGILMNLRSIGRWLIGARIAKGMTQKALADKLNVSTSQVSRDERNEYHAITVDRAQEIMEALDIRFKAQASNPVTQADDEGLVYA